MPESTPTIFPVGRIVVIDEYLPHCVLTTVLAPMVNVLIHDHCNN